MQHFDRKLVRTGLTAPASQVFPENLPEEPTCFSNESHFAFSSTPVHSQTSRTFTPNPIPFRLSDASPGVGSSVCGQLLFTPEQHTPSKNPTCGSEFNRDNPAFEHARRNLFQAYVPKLSCETNSCFKDLISDSPPSSGYVSTTSAGSVLSSSGSSGCVEKLDTAEAKEFCEGEKGEDVQEESLVHVLAFPDHTKPVDCESGEPADIEGFAEEESELQGMCSTGEQPSLIGDFSRPYSLPLVRSRNQDLKAISPDTVCAKPPCCMYVC